MKRKTIDVEQVRKWGNLQLARTDVAPEYRRGVADIVHEVLMDTGNYHGFNYLDWLEGGCDRWHADGKPADNKAYLGDQTRIVYH